MGADTRALRVEVLDELRVVVDFDAYVWLMTDPRDAVGVDPLAEVPSLRELPRTIRLKYLTEVNRWTRLANGRPVGLQQRTPGGPSRSLLWRDLQNGYGVVDVASVVFADRFGCWSFLDLWRQAPADPFDDTEAAYLSAVAEVITTALRTSQSLTFGAPPPHTREGLGPMVLLLDNQLHVHSQTEATAEWLAMLLPAASGAPLIPAAAYNVAAQLLAVEEGIDGNAPSARVHLGDGLWITLRAGRLNRDAIAVTIERPPPDRLEVFSRCFRSQPQGDRTARAPGNRMRYTGTGGTDVPVPHTVQDHLKSIFAKTAVRNRRNLLSRALGRR